MDDMDTDIKREDPFTLLMNMSQGGGALEESLPSTSSGLFASQGDQAGYYMNEIALKAYNDTSDSDDDDDEVDEDKRALKLPLRRAIKAARNKTQKKKKKQSPATKKKAVSKKKKAKKTTTNKAVALPNLSSMMSFEEQTQLEEPIEIDMRDVYKTYGISPMEMSRMRASVRKQISATDATSLFIGEFRLKMTQGKADEALPMMFHYIRMYPHQTELLDIVGEYYYGIGNPKRALDFYLLSVEWNQNDISRWGQMADIAIQNGMYKSAITFYDRAIRLDHKNPSFYFKKGKVQEQIKQYDSAILTYEKCLSILDHTDWRDITVILQNKFNIARILLKHKNDAAKAQTVVEEALVTYPVENTNKLFHRYLALDFADYCDILFKNEEPLKVLQKFLDYSIVKLDTYLLSDSGITTDGGSVSTIETLSDLISSNVESFQFSLPFRCSRIVELTLKSKFIAVFIYQRKYSFADHFLPEFTVERMRGEGQAASTLAESVFPAIAEAFISVGLYERAEELVSRLLEIDESCSHYRFLSGLCLANHPSGEPRLAEAIDAFEAALRADRNNFDAVQELSKICNAIGDPQRALDNMSKMGGSSGEQQENQAPMSDVTDLKLWLSRCSLLYLCKRWEEYVQAAKLLLSSDMYFFERFSDLKQIIHPNMCFTSMMRVSKRLRKRFSKKTNEDGSYKHTVINFTGGRLSTGQFLEHFRRVLFVQLNYLKDPSAALLWAFSSWLSVHLEEHCLTFVILLFRACIDAKSKEYTYELGRYLLKEHPRSGRLWYAFSVAMNDIYQDVRHKRFCMRLWNLHHNNLNILNMNGHIALLNGRYRHALAIFLLVKRTREKDGGELSSSYSSFRYDTFYIGLCYLHMLMQNHTLDKCSLFAQMLTFFDDYVQRVGKCQETYYNMGRVYHQLGFYRHAAEMYTAALETPLKIYDARFDLSPEVAFNLSQIYRKGGDHGRANRLLAQYCTI